MTRHNAVARLRTRNSLPKEVVSALERNASIEASAESAIRDYQVDSIQAMSMESIVHLQALLQNGHTFGLWETPPIWCLGSGPSLWSVDLLERIVHFLPADVQSKLKKGSPSDLHLKRLLDNAVLCVTRYLVLCRVGPVGMKNATGRSLDPTTISGLAYGPLPRMAAQSVVLRLKEEVGLQQRSVCFGELDAKAFEGGSISGGFRKACLGEFERMRILSDKGLWSDSPKGLSKPVRTTHVRGRTRQPSPAIKRDPHKPLPDDYVSEMGQKSAWLITQLAPAIIVALEALHDVWRAASTEGLSGPQLSVRCSELLASHKWIGSDGNEISELPFPIRLSLQGVGMVGTIAEEYLRTWPPRYAGQIFALANVIQSAHLFVVGLSMGPRKTEMISLKRDCVTHAKDGEKYADGRTYKLVQRHDGEERDWVLPDFAIHAIEQQVRLVRAYEMLSNGEEPRDPSERTRGNFLWGQVLRRGGAGGCSPMAGQQVNYALRFFARSLGMSESPGGQALRPHRLRKTLARMAALAITHAPKILQDVFGHKSIEMTLYYILCDKDLRAEIETVAKELRIMRAQTVIGEMAAADDAQTALAGARGGDAAQTGQLRLGGYGGLAAITIHKTTIASRAQAHQRGEDWGANSVRALAEIFTMQGRTWQLVRPGVICTKAMGQAAPCSKKRGNPEVANCRSECDHRLEEAWHRQDVDESIAECVKLYLEDMASGRDLVAEHWASQVRENINRFDDVREKWMKDSTVRALVEERVDP